MKVIAVAVVAAGIAILVGYLIRAILGGIRDDISDGPARRDERGRGGQ